MGAQIRKCSCTGLDSTDFQDSKYGLGMRVHNVGIKQLTCTCCGKITK